LVKVLAWLDEESPAWDELIYVVTIPYKNYLSFIEMIPAFLIIEREKRENKVTPVECYFS
jgi:hypothetical protein